LKIQGNTFLKSTDVIMAKNRRSTNRLYEVVCPLEKS